MAPEGRVQRPRSTSRCGPRSRSGDARKIERSGSAITLNEINKVVALLNALPAQQPGMRLCPIDWGHRCTAGSLRATCAAPLAVAKVASEVSRRRAT